MSSAYFESVPTTATKLVIAKPEALRVGASWE
jgi:hypothetical protein